MPSSAITVQGQAWDQISLARYGSEKQMSPILPANVEEMDALIFGGDTVIEVPDVRIQAVRNLPPWERM